jgi:hypothetical protein
MIERLTNSPLPIPVPHQCCWPVRDKATGKLRFCHWPALRGFQYCPVHPGEYLPQGEWS